MTLSIKENVELAASKTGSRSSIPDPNAAQSNRANPRCLEMPVTVRSLPGENGGALGSGPIREEGRTVIVFDNGGVLRLWNNLPPGQKLILSNALGNDVVCRVVSGRNLPTVQGYIEVEFIEAFNDFWGVRQGASAPGGAQPVAPPLEMPPAPPDPPRVARTMPPAVAQMPPRVPAPASSAAIRPESAAMNRSGGAPTFDDIPGLLRMSPPAAHPAAVPFDIENNKSQLTQARIEAATSSVEKDAPVAVADVIPVKRTIPSPADLPVAPARAPVFSSELDARGMLSSSSAASVPAARETGSRIGLIIGGVALLCAGFGAGYLFMHRPNTAAPIAAVAGVEPTPPPPPIQASAPEPVQAVEQPVERTAPDHPAVAAPAPAAPIREAQPAAPANAVNARVAAAAADAAKAEQAELEEKQRQQMSNLKISSPAAPKQDPGKLSQGAAPEVTGLATAAGDPSMTALSSVVHSANQPAPPPPPQKVVTLPKLVSATKPVYPAEVRNLDVQGSVTVLAAIDTRGNVSSAKALNGPASLREAAIDAVKHWKYSPGLIDGQPVPSQVSVVVQFSLK